MLRALVPTIVSLLAIGFAAGSHLSAQAPTTTPDAKTPIDPANYDRLRVGEGADGRIVVPTNQVLSPAGRQVAFAGRPTDVALSPDGKWLAVLDLGHVALIDIAKGEVVSRMPHSSGSFAGILFTPDGKKLLASNLRGSIGVFEVEADGELEKLPPITLPVLKASSGENLANSPTGPQSPNQQASPSGADSRNACPVVLALDPNGKTLWAALNLRNSLAEIDLAASKLLREIPVGNAPYGVALVGKKAYVTN